MVQDTSCACCFVAIHFWSCAERILENPLTCTDAIHRDNWTSAHCNSIKLQLKLWSPGECSHDGIRKVLPCSLDLRVNLQSCLVGLT